MLVRSEACGYTSKAYDVTHASDVTTQRFKFQDFKIIIFSNYV